MSDIAPIRVATPEAAVWIACLGMGIAATISHLAMNYALAFAPSTTRAPLNYLEIVTAMTYGLVFFGAFPAGMAWAGILAIVVSGLSVIDRERVGASLS